MTKLFETYPLPLNKTVIKDSFWSEYQKLVRDVVLSYQKDALNDNIPGAEPSHAIKNFKIAAGVETGEFYGWVFQDSDVAKWLEAVAYSLSLTPDRELERSADEVIDIIEKAQQKDGYLDTYFIIKEPEKRWTNLEECHELYCAGHMIEAGVAYFSATGKRKLLDVVCRLADYIDSVFGSEPGKIKGYCGHQEIELALVKLYRITGNECYLNLSRYFIDERGKEPYYFRLEREKRDILEFWPGFSKFKREYMQTHLTVREQKTAEGHAVRVVYMCSAISDIAGETGDAELLDTCRSLWNSIVKKRMYITGGIGSAVFGEAFTFDYNLPNDTVYAESCASVGLVMFAHRMLKIEAKGEYGDVMERALYNNVLSGMALDGKSFFYVNPLEVLPESCEKNPAMEHIKPVRQKWFSCSCCPPNIARLLMSLSQYIYTAGKNSIYTHLYIGGKAEFDLDGTSVTLSQETNYPWDGNVRLKATAFGEKEFTLALRIPSWCRNYKLAVNGKVLETGVDISKGYAKIRRIWNDGDTVELSMDMPAELIQANPKVRADAGKVAIARGPLVYCLEEVDNGSNLSAISIPLDCSLVYEKDSSLPKVAVAIRTKAIRTEDTGWADELYRPAANIEKETSIKAVPYFMWCNRKPGEMNVWIRQKNRV